MMSYIIENVYLGGVDDACDTQKLQKNGITHILTVDHRPLGLEQQKGFSYKYVHALDMETQDLLTHFAESLTFIEEGRAAGGVFIHCYYGVSRSATLVLAYIMQKLDMSLDDAETLVMKQRPAIRPNPSFHAQLELFEMMGNTIDQQHELYKIYKLQMLAIKMNKAQVECSLPVGAYSEDPSAAGTVEGGLFRCKKCRRSLFKKCSVLSHERGLGQAAFGWRTRLPSSMCTSLDEAEAEPAQCTQSLFIEPVHWMGDTILAMEGKLLCPKCSAKLGSFKWTGEKCPCGAWITPAFHIQNSKVDQIVPVRPVPRKPAGHQRETCIGDKILTTNTQTTSLRLDHNKVETSTHLPTGAANLPTGAAGHCFEGDKIVISATGVSNTLSQHGEEEKGAAVDLMMVQSGTLLGDLSLAGGEDLPPLN